ncbi:MAG: response regulator, partial [Clostridiales bacterium]|nr:response regulator [Clostridiales bacterium]
MKILLVEDEKRMAEALLELLRQENYEADWCPDGISGQDAIESGIYDIVILDVMLPGKSGIDVTRQVRSKGIGVPIMMLTARSELEDKVAELDGVADDYLTKPLLSNDLLERIRSLGRPSNVSAEGESDGL